MSIRAIRLTANENQALALLFDATQNVMGTEEQRLVDPEGVIAHLFDDIDAACAFVKRLIKLDLLTLLFHANGNEDVDGRKRGTYRACQEKWMEAVSAAILIPDPPLMAEDRRLRDILAGKRQRREMLARRRAELEQELRDVNEQIAATDRDIESAQSIRNDLAALRQRIEAVAAENAV